MTKALCINCGKQWIWSPGWNVCPDCASARYVPVSLFWPPWCGKKAHRWQLKQDITKWLEEGHPITLQPEDCLYLGQYYWRLYRRLQKGLSEGTVRIDDSRFKG